MTTEETQRDTKRHKRDTNQKFISWLVARVFIQETQETQIMYIYPPIWIMNNSMKYKYNIIDTLIMNRMLIITICP